MKRNFKNNIKNKIRVCTYNILAPSVAENNSLHKISCKGECITWKYRFELICKEVLNYNPDIICFQEAQTKYVYKDIFPFFNKLEYQGFYIPQTHFRSSIKTDFDNFGIVILFNTNKLFAVFIAKPSIADLLFALSLLSNVSADNGSNLGSSNADPTATVVSTRFFR